MLKVFLVEDESIMREGLRDNIPWETYGYQFAGEASDGEMALPLIRKVRPDVLITDIKMPFMDGLELSQIVTKEFPNTKIIIISGYDDFEYARKAIDIGVEQYLLKPVTKQSLTKVLETISEKIEAQKEQTADLRKFQEEYREFEQLSIRHFFEKVFDRKLSLQEIYDESEKLSIDLKAQAFNIAFVYFQDDEDELYTYFLRFKEYIVFRWNINIYCILILGDSDNIDALSERCKSNAERICINKIEQSNVEDTKWYITVGESVERLSLLPDCYATTNDIFSYRFLAPSQHIITKEVVSHIHPSGNHDYEEPDLKQIDPEIIKGFLSQGSKEEINAFATGYLASLEDALKSKLFRNYLLLNVRFSTLSYVETIGGKKEEFISSLDESILMDMSADDEKIKKYIIQLFTSAIELREQLSTNQFKGMIKKAVSYIDENYKDEELSLNDVASICNVSPNYFSAIFSTQMNMTFVEYVTKKRMELAKKLLKTTSKHTGEIANEVGYKDQHYFSVVFKKTQGMSPREYRG